MSDYLKFDENGNPLMSNKDYHPTPAAQGHNPEGPNKEGLSRHNALTRQASLATHRGHGLGVG